MPQSEANRYCFRIGVTGHRRLDDPAAVEALVKRAIDAEAGKLFPAMLRKNIEDGRQAGTAPISYCVVSPLAEGADRVVAAGGPGPSLLGTGDGSLRSTT